MTDDALLERQIAIRRVLRLNAKKKLSGKPRGLKWIRSKQAQCAVMGHEGGNPFSGPGDPWTCCFCGAKLD